MKMSKGTKYGAAGVVVVAVLAFIISGVLASTSISVNSGNNITLGAGSSYATTCEEDITVTPLLSFNSTNGAYQLTTISVKNIGTTPAGASSCVGKTLNLAFLHSEGNKFASWNIPSLADANEYHFGARSGGNSGSVYFATATFGALSAAGLSSIAVSIN
jgi:hypothetical protein